MITKYFKIFISYFIYLILLTGLTISNARALEINDARFGIYENKIRIVLDTNEITDFRAFTLSSPYRIVLDLPHFKWNAGASPKPVATQISDIRQGKLDHNISRVVFDLTKPIKIESAFLLPAQNKKSNRIVIDYNFVEEPEFEKHKSTIHGTLTNVAKPSQISQTNTPRPPNNEQKPRIIKTQDKPLIVIDPGHGGQDPGAQSKNKLYEKHVVLALAKELKQQLLETGQYRVVLTRETDIYIRLKDRVKFARNKQADLFISLHADSIHKPHISGTSVYTISKKSSDAQTAKLAEKENQSDLMAGLELSIDDEQVAFILSDFLMNDTMNQSKFFANTLVSKLQKNRIKTLENPHRYAGFAVLKAPDIPSILVEAGFMSNAKEAKLLNQHKHRKKLAKAITDGINAYFSYAKQNTDN